MGIVIKLTEEPEDIFILHATFKNIIVENWKDLRAKIGKGHFYEKFVYRRMDMERTDRDIQLFDRFYDQFSDCKFNLSPNVFFSRVTSFKIPARLVDRTGNSDAAAGETLALPDDQDD